MATARDIRRLAFQVLFQLDAHAEATPEAIQEWVRDEEGFSERDHRRAIALATGAFAARADADRATEVLAPTWPASRQAAVDRAILRLAYHEMALGKTDPRIIINEAVELAKSFSTEKSPAFINALLDKIMKSQSPRPSGNAP